MPPDYSLLVLTSGRDDHLARTLDGVRAMDSVPAEIVVAFMNQPHHPERLLDDVTVIDVASEHRLPLAETRNRLAGSATCDVLVFLDVDCVPARDFGDQLLRAQRQHGGLVMGTPRYLPPGCGVGVGEMAERSQPHPILDGVEPGPTDNYDLFWSLCFAISKGDFQASGGFDPSLIGYGGEDTDFAWSCRKVGIAFAHSTATVFHQHHASYKPPLNHFDDIVENANVFFQKWGRWPMGGWLRAFADRQLIDWDETNGELTVRRRPTDVEIAAARADSTVS